MGPPCSVCDLGIWECGVQLQLIVNVPLAIPEQVLWWVRAHCPT